MNRKSSPSGWQKVRKLFNDIHLWLGLISGLIVFLICFSGTIYTYNTEIRNWALKDMYAVEVPAGAKVLPIETLIKGLKEEGKVTAVRVPVELDRAYAFTVKKKEAKGDKKPTAQERSKPDNKTKGAAKSDRGTTLLVNPYTGALIGNPDKVDHWAVSLMKQLFSLHRWLFLDQVEKPLINDLENRKLGSYISGAATILFTLGVLTGMVIWVPNKVRSWRKGLKVKWSGNWKRINHDIHNSLGFYACVFLLLMSLTGPQWSFEWYKTGLRKTLGTYQPPDFQAPEGPKSGVQESKSTVEFYMQQANVVLPYEGEYLINMPKDSVDVVSITKYKTGFFAPAAADKVLLDQYSASVLLVEKFKDKAFNERVSGSIKAIHIGNVYGQFTKLLYFIACLIATTLPVTGIMIWLNKMKKKAKNKKVKA